MILQFIENFVSLITFCLKVRIRFHLLRLIVYDSAFNSILQFLVNCGILSPIHIINAN